MGMWPQATRGDSRVSMFGAVWDTGAVVFPARARILEIGCAEGDWQTPMLAVRPDVLITGIDWRPCERPGTIIQGNVLTENWPRHFFDAVVGISSIEHIGLGHYDHDPLDADGDQHCMERVVRWLKPGGVFYADVPFGPVYSVQGTAYRVYDEPSLARLLVSGLTLERRWFTTWAADDHVLHDTPAIDPGSLQYVALLARKGE